MAYDSGELKAAWEIEAELKRVEDRRDYERELAGIDIGRMARFHTGDFVEERRQGRSGASSAHRSSQREFTSRLQMLLATNTAYANLYNGTMDALGDAEAATDRAIAKAQEALTEAEHQLEKTLNRAARLPDGTRVFRDEKGQVWTEHRTRVSEADAASIEWRGDEPAYQQFLEESESVFDRLTHLEALQGFRVDTLGGFRDRMMDRENPATPDEMQQFREVIEQRAPAAVRSEMSMSASSVQAVVPRLQDLDIPAL